VSVAGQNARTLADASYSYTLQNLEGKPVKAVIGTHYGHKALADIDAISSDEYYKRFILDNIDNSSYSEKPLDSVEDKITFLRDTFQAEYGWSIDRYGMQRALTEWLQGLPSAVSLPFYNHDILELAKNAGTLKHYASEKEEDKILENYFSFMANKILQLFNGYRIPETF
jgi:hypothetical protein